MRYNTELEQEQGALRHEIKDAVEAASHGVTNLAIKALTVYEAAGTSDDPRKSASRFAEMLEELADSLKQRAEYIRTQAGYVKQAMTAND